MKIQLDQLSGLVRSHLEFFALNRKAEKQLGLSVIQYHLLNVIRARPGISSQVLAREVGAHPSTLTQTLKRLSKKNSIFVSEHPNDKRKIIVSLTREGMKLIQDFEMGWSTLS